MRVKTEETSVKGESENNSTMGEEALEMNIHLHSLLMLSLINLILYTQIHRTIY